MAGVEATRRDIVTADDRTLEVWATPSRSSALLLILGTPCAGLPYRPAVASAAARDLQYLSYSRPGYGSSTRQPGRSVVDCTSDVRTIAVALGVERLLVIGWSGGGPHALACAAGLEGLVVSAATLAGVAPWSAEGLDWLAGMAPENVAEFGAAREGEAALERYLTPAAAALRDVTGASVADALGGLVSEVDRASLTGEFAEASAEAFREAVREGPWGWLDDDLAFARDWGFRLDTIRVPVAVWQGDQDLMVPFAHGAWLAEHVRGARAELHSGEGHLSLAVNRFDDIVEDLVAHAV
jgi:pimeloyl-ACP methyl ester carboxylesterase